MIKAAYKIADAIADYEKSQRLLQLCTVAPIAKIPWANPRNSSSDAKGMVIITTAFKIIKKFQIL
jgi:hypothetical protein